MAAVVWATTLPLYADTVTTIVALRFTSCRSIPGKLTVKISGETLDANRTSVNNQEYWIATDAPSFTPANEEIEVRSGGVPIFCGRGTKTISLPGYGYVGLFVFDCDQGWLLEITSKPPATFKYARGACEGENAGPTPTQLLDVRKDETIKVALRGLNRKPLRTVDVTRETIDKEGEKGVWSLRGRSLLDPGVIASIPNPKLADKLAATYGIEFVSFQAK
jgi:hypothetical protein